MLIRFQLENWMSYRDKSEFTMLASSEKQHAETLSRVPKFRLKLLPVSAIYGGNASGKSNFIEALSFVKELVVRGVGVNDLIPVKRFKLDDEGVRKSLCFEFALLINELIYEYKFNVDPRRVLFEELSVINSSSKKLLFRRLEQDFKLGDSIKQKDLLEFSCKTTRQNTLFVNSTISHNITEFKPVYDWFAKTLIIITPNSKFGPVHRLIDQSDPISEEVSRILSDLDTGIEALAGQDIDISSLGVPDEALNAIRSQLKDGQRAVMRMSSTNTKILFSREGDEILAQRIVANHKKSDGSLIPFMLDEESDGSNRLIDLAPALLMLTTSKEPIVLVIDELDRSLHTKISREFIERFLATCEESRRNQLIYISHDVLLMDQSLLRRDELWVATRDSSGASNLTSFSEYKDIRNDKNLLLSYLLGRLGGLPNIRGAVVPLNFYDELYDGQTFFLQSKDWF